MPLKPSTLIANQEISALDLPRTSNHRGVVWCGVTVFLLPPSATLLLPVRSSLGILVTVCPRFWILVSTVVVVVDDGKMISYRLLPLAVPLPPVTQAIPVIGEKGVNSSPFRSPARHPNSYGRYKYSSKYLCSKGRPPPR
jgi:hypothetical protein